SVQSVVATMFYNSLRCRPSALVEIIGRSLGSVHQSSSIAVLKAALQEQLDTIEQAGTLITERIVTSKQAPEIRVAGCRNPVLNFCANNYLGLSVRLHLLL
ncbi:GCAT (predicted), partial [Pycnogonum litorale]